MSEWYRHHLFKHWMIFGKHRKTGLVDVSDGDRDVLTGVKEPEAEAVCEERHKILQRLDDVLEQICPDCNEEEKK